MSGGTQCRHYNPPRSRKCGECGKPRPAKRRPEHMHALDIPYETYVELNGGEHCGICGAPKPPDRKLDRDHDHHVGIPRGVLCRRCNRNLPSDIDDPAWLRAAADYLQRAQERGHYAQT